MVKEKDPGGGASGKTLLDAAVREGLGVPEFLSGIVVEELLSSEKWVSAAQSQPVGQAERGADITPKQVSVKSHWQPLI